MTQSYLAMLADSLDRKITVLQKIEEENRKQHDALSGETPDLEAFDSAVDTKGELIEELDQLNDGFGSLFAQVREEVDGNREKYKEEIASMQDKIRTITALSSSIQAEEERNRKLVEKSFSESRKDMIKGKKSAKAALDYYHNMARSTFTPPQFLDSRH